ncbi:MAG: hypothetical protein ACKO38_08905 [Planctomycetota bacterium]
MDIARFEARPALAGELNRHNAFPDEDKAGIVARVAPLNPDDATTRAIRGTPVDYQSPTSEKWCALFFEK